MADEPEPIVPEGAIRVTPFSLAAEALHNETWEKAKGYNFLTVVQWLAWLSFSVAMHDKPRDDLGAAKLNDSQKELFLRGGGVVDKILGLGWSPSDTMLFVAGAAAQVAKALSVSQAPAGAETDPEKKAAGTE